MRGQVGSPLITVLLQVRVLPDPPRLSVTYFVFVARIATTARLIVARWCLCPSCRTHVRCNTAANLTSSSSSNII